MTGLEQIRALIAHPWSSAGALGFRPDPAPWLAEARAPNGEALYAVGDPDVLRRAGWPGGDYRARYWALRADLGLAADLSRLVEALRPAKREALAERRMKRRPLHLHLLLGWEDGSGAWVLDDRGEGTALAWATMLRYLALDAQRRDGALLLIVSARAFRRWALLALTRLLGGQARRLTALACGREALTRGRAAAWEVLGEGWALLPAGDWPRLAMPGGVRAVRRRKEALDLSAPPWAAALPAIEGCGAAAQAVLRCLAQRPLLDVRALAAFCDLGEEEAAGALEALRVAGLVEGEGGGWWITAAAAEALAARAGLGDLARRHAFFLAHLRRAPGHTRAVHRFFARLKTDLAQRARATRPLADGRAYYEWGTYESEMGAAHRYLRDGRMRLHRPDGYAALRVGERWVRFFLEMDGWLDERGRVGGRSMCSYPIWLEKLARRKDYRLSGWWALRYPDFPMLLVVTTDARNLALIQAGLAELGETEGVRVALAEEVGRAGPSAQVWREVTARGAGARDYLCAGFAQPGLVQGAEARPDVLAAMARAEALRVASEAWAAGRRRRVR